MPKSKTSLLIKKAKSAFMSNKENQPMTKNELSKFFNDNFSIVEEYIEEATAFSHNKMPEIPENADAYDNSRFWGYVASYMVAVLRMRYKENKQ